jgi:peptidoglycan/LPS O-acetylase OafA/YrhL
MEIVDQLPMPLGTSSYDERLRRQNTPEKLQRYYRPELDVLRFFAFLMVFLSHVIPGDFGFFAQAHIPSSVANLIIGISAGGAFGVDLFFTLSSFLITTLLLREREAYGTIKVRSFYVRRILRIWPLYFAFLFIVAPAVEYFLPNESLSVKYLLAFALMSGNWAFVFWGYPDSISAPLWSVSIEEQFYLSWPLVLRRWVDHLVKVALALLAVSCITRVYLIAHGAIHPQIWCNSLARLDPFACGALLAVYAQRRSIALSPWIRLMLLCFAFVLLTAVGHYEDFAGAKSLITFPAVTVASIALIVSALGMRITSHDTPLVRTFVYLGRISYGLYVFHWMFIVILGVASAHEPFARFGRIAIALVVTIATAAGSYHFLEKPFLQWKGKFERIKSRPG